MQWKHLHCMSDWKVSAIFTYDLLTYFIIFLFIIYIFPWLTDKFFIFQQPIDKFHDFSFQQTEEFFNIFNVAEEQISKLFLRPIDEFLDFIFIIKWWISWLLSRNPGTNFAISSHDLLTNFVIFFLVVNWGTNFTSSSLDKWMNLWATDEIIYFFFMKLRK